MSLKYSSESFGDLSLPLLPNHPHHSHHQQTLGNLGRVSRLEALQHFNEINTSELDPTVERFFKTNKKSRIALRSKLVFLSYFIVFIKDEISKKRSMQLKKTKK